MNTTTQKNTAGSTAPGSSTATSKDRDSQGYDAYGLRFPKVPNPLEADPLAHNLRTMDSTSKISGDAQAKLEQDLDRDIAARTMDVMCNPNLSTAEFGALAEYLTCITLEAAGMHILERNYHSRFGEIDLIVLDDDTISFVEVKARRSTRYGSAAEAVTPRKQQRIQKTALEWLRHKPEDIPFSEKIRFDVAAIQVQGHHVKCALITSAF
jgi:putative endonuclease